MCRLKLRNLSLIFMGLFFLALGCSDEDQPRMVLGPGGTETDTVPNFSLIDVNPNSSTYNQLVSPRDFLGKISAWYFGHAS